VATKCEDEAAEERASRLEEVRGPVHRISSATGRGVARLIQDAWALVHADP
jgi:hypothetical protein